MRIVFAGTPQAAVPALDGLVAAGHELVAVVTREDAPVGRKRVLTPSPVAARAEELGLEVVRANRLDEAVAERLLALEPDLGVIVAYGGLVREPLLHGPRLGWINLHFSLLPRWRGAAPVQRAVLAGDTTTGIAVFELEAGLDTGPVHVNREVPIGDDETAGELLERLSHEGVADVVEVVARLADGTAVATPQEGAPTHAEKLTAADGAIDWSLPSRAVHARIRGATPEPGATTTLDGERFKVHAARRADDADDADDAAAAVAALEPGEVRLVGGRVLVGTGDGALELVRVQPAGRTTMAAADW
ncbi:MAG: methionyl-tRNA formyltransferase, partial [Microbacteriaceae bacterium]|nr:methionyl-tRNA formyltransferase [Microbacteriaceae bacterium]